MKRRDFIKYGSLASIGTAFLPNGNCQTFSPLYLQSCAGINERVIVLIRLIGGNDGINTIIPIDQYSSYANLRPTIRIPDSGTDAYVNLDPTLPVQDQVGLNPALLPLKNLYDSGMMTVIQGVKYPNQDRSHFKSTDLWMSGGDGTNLNNNLGSGWLARFFESSYPGAAGNPNVYASPLAIQLAEKKPAMLFHSDHTHGISTNLSGQDVSGYYSVVSGIGGAPITNIPSSDHGDMLSYIMQVEQNSNVYSQAISNAFNAGNNQATYPAFDLADQLKTVARLVHGGLQTKVFLVSLNGFDTHDAQVDPTTGTSAGRHAVLLDTLSQSISAFFQDIQALGIEDKFLVSTFSEFGRKVQENGNYGTDHGGVAPMFIFGKGLSGGVLGTNVDLSEADQSNNYQIETMQYDYRSVFATIIQDWLGADTSIVDYTLFDNNDTTVTFTQSKLNSLISSNYKVTPNCYFNNFIITGTEKQVDNNLILYPNPAKDQVHIQFEDIQSGTLRLCTTMGRVVVEKRVKQSSTSSLYFGNLPAGHYFVHFNGQDGYSITKEITVH